MFGSNLARQVAINAICSYLTLYKIRSSHDLVINFEKIIKKINQDPKIFNHSDTFLQRTKIFSYAVSTYARITEYNIKIPDNIDWGVFHRYINKNSFKEHKIPPVINFNNNVNISEEGGGI